MIIVICGIIYRDDKILIAKRKSGKLMEGKWEFPGGKIDDYETEQVALRRELYEELGMKVNIQKRVGEHIHKYSDFTIRLISYKCKFIDATFMLSDHDEYKWVYKEDLENYDLADADKPFINLI